MHIHNAHLCSLHNVSSISSSWFIVCMQSQGQEGFEAGLATSLLHSPGRLSKICCCEKVLILMLVLPQLPLLALKCQLLF